MDPKNGTVPPEAGSIPPRLDFAQLLNGAEALTRARSVNRILIKSERPLTDAQSLPAPVPVPDLRPGFYRGFERDRADAEANGKQIVHVGRLFQSRPT
jgi:hypothetical protein